MKRIIAALQVTLDGKIEGPNGELDWIGSWGDDYGLMDRVDTCVLGAGMWPGYKQYWTSILADPTGVLELTGRTPEPGEIEYARWADRTPHVVVSTTMTDPGWATARVVRDLDDVAALKDGHWRRHPRRRRRHAGVEPDEPRTRRRALPRRPPARARSRNGAVQGRHEPSPAPARVGHTGRRRARRAHVPN